MHQLFIIMIPKPLTIMAKQHCLISFFTQFLHQVRSLCHQDADTLDPSVKRHLVSITISKAGIFNALSSLNPNKATGIDGIGPKVLKHCAVTLFKPLHFLFSLHAVVSKSIPYWRIHSIVPVYKSGDRHWLITTVLYITIVYTSKVLEQII